ncbi:hypothetical protein ACFRDV_16530 [Streptomyces fagopyri]|uniref:hypothetical protein n=1 Tax=Streptomyces fagopyri TaxID=2662397 RepID=UPI0036754841
MSGEPFSFADCEATFGPETKPRKDREADEAPRFTTDQILRLRTLCAPFRVPPPEPEEGRLDAEEG